MPGPLHCVFRRLKTGRIVLKPCIGGLKLDQRRNFGIRRGYIPPGFTVGPTQRIVSRFASRLPKLANGIQIFLDPRNGNIPACVQVPDQLPQGSLRRLYARYVDKPADSRVTITWLCFNQPENLAATKNLDFGAR